jgi:hypothetical protein
MLCDGTEAPATKYKEVDSNVITVMLKARKKVIGLMYAILFVAFSCFYTFILCF